MLADDRYQKATEIIAKLRKHEPLTDAEIDYVDATLKDPLDEFCMREGTYRAIEMCKLDREIASEHEDGLADAIRDVIDNDELLYDKLDDAVRDYIDDEGLAE